MTTMKTSVLGLDLATRHSGLCFIPHDWDGTFASLLTLSVEYDLPGAMDELTKISRIVATANEILRFIDVNEPEEIALENYAFSARSSSVTMQAEIGGIVKSQIYLALDRVPTVIPPASARKTLTGGLRGKRKEDRANGVKPLEAKKQVKVFLENRGFPFDNEDVMDAFVVAYHQYVRFNGVSPEIAFLPLEESEVMRPYKPRKK